MLNTVLRLKPSGAGPSAVKGAIAGGGIVLRGPDLELGALRSLHLGPVSSPTHAEYATLLEGLKLAGEHSVEHLRIRSDNLSLVRHLNGETRLHPVWAESLAPAILTVRPEFRTFDLRSAPSSHAVQRRDGQPTADLLARQAIGLGARPVRGRRSGR